MALIDYKFWYVIRDDAGYITEAGIRFYVGDITTADEYGVAVTRYRRTSKLPRNKIPAGVTIINDGAGDPVVVLTPTAFGKIQTDSELRAYCNGQLARIPGFTPIQEQT